MSENEQTEGRKPIARTNPVVEFVSEIPTISRGAGGFKPRTSKYDAVYAALQENPGRWAYIGEGDGLYGALTGYRKRRELEDMTIANRGGKVYAGVNVEVVHANGDEPANAAGDDVPEDDGADDDLAARAMGEDPEGAEAPQEPATAPIPADDGWA